ncbi:MAG: D-aminoacyl-tRNA deacylase [Halobacteriota archaeon]
MHAAIICSELDAASQNVARHLLKRVPWARCSEGPVQWTYGNFQLLVTKGRLIKQEALGRELNADLLIFASRHQSEKRKGPVFTAHFTGNIEGSQQVAPTLACAAPRALKLVVERLKRLSSIEVLVEVTHHCPCAIETPSLFVEIGSSKSEWTNEALGDTMAQAILSLDSPLLNSQCVTAVGFGGPHYALRHTDVLLGSNICFGHIFAEYQLERLSPAIVQEAFEKSRAQFAHFDRKQMGAERDRLLSIVHNLDYEVLRKGDIEDHGDVSWELYLKIRRALRLCGVVLDGMRIRVSASLRDSLDAYTLSMNYFEFKRLELNTAIIKLACAVDHDSFKHLIEIEKIVYLERKDGNILDIFVPAEFNLQDVTSALLLGCMEILKKRYDVEYSQRKSKLYISERKFNARLARSLGVAEGPLFAKLAHGEPIRINSKVIKPEDVFTKVKKAFDVATADKLGQH